MAMWATVDDITRRWIGDDAPCDAAKIDAWITDAEALILAEFPDLQVRIDDESLSLDRVRLVIARMVTRAFRNPTGTRQRQETTGPFSGSVTYAGDTPGDLWLTDEERNLLGGLVGARRQRAFTVNTIDPRYTAGWWSGPDLWLPVAP